MRLRRSGINGTAPGKRLVLGVALAELPSDLGTRQLDAEIEGMRAVPLDPETAEQIDGALRDGVTGAVVDMDAVLGNFDAEIGVADLRRGLGDLAGTAGERPPVAFANSSIASPIA